MPPQQDQQYPVDYLNQISTQQQKPGITNKRFLLLIGGAVALILIAVIFMVASSGVTGPKEKMQTLAARLLTLQTVASDAQANIKSGDLRDTNSNLTIFLTNTNRDIAEPLTESGIDVEKLDEKIVAQESGETLTADLEEARLNAVFDRTYAREMSYQLDTVSVLIREIYNSTNNASFKSFLENTNANLEPLREQFSNFNAADG
jgi:ABC-type Na+ efflux pump permease subunit